MIIKQEVQLNKQMFHFMQDREGHFLGTGEYTYTENPEMDLNIIINKCVIHVYPKEDTVDVEGNLNGYADSILTDVVVYNQETLEYRVLSEKDNIRIEARCQTRIFKDLSTAYIFNEPVKVDRISTTVTVHSLENYRHSIGR